MRSGIYNGVGFVKGHEGPGEPGAGSRAVRRFWSDRSSQTLDATTGSRKLRVRAKPGSFFQGFVLRGFSSAGPDQGSPLESCGGTPVPPLIYAVLTTMIPRSNSPPRAGRPGAQSISRSRPERNHARYSGYRTCEPAARSRSAGAASSTTGRPSGGRWRLSPPRWRVETSAVNTCDATRDPGAPPSAPLPPAASASSSCLAC